MSEKHEGKVIRVTTPAGGMVKGDGYKFGAGPGFGVAVRNSDAGEPGAVSMIGVWNMKKAAAVTPVFGQRAYFDDTTKEVTNVSGGGGDDIGWFAPRQGTTIGAADARARVRLSGTGIQSSGVPDGDLAHAAPVGSIVPVNDPGPGPFIVGGGMIVGAVPAGFFAGFSEGSIARYVGPAAADWVEEVPIDGSIVVELSTGLIYRFNLGTTTWVLLVIDQPSIYRPVTTKVPENDPGVGPFTAGEGRIVGLAPAGLFIGFDVGSVARFDGVAWAQEQSGPLDGSLVWAVLEAGLYSHKAGIWSPYPGVSTIYVQTFAAVDSTHAARQAVDPAALTSTDIVAADAAASAADGSSDVAAADAVAGTAPDGGPDGPEWTAGVTLMNETKADFNLLRTLVTSLKTQFDAAVALMNEDKADTNLLRADVTAVRAQVINVRVDQVDTAEVVNAVVDDLQTLVIVL